MANSCRYLLCLFIVYCNIFKFFQRVKEVLRITILQKHAAQVCNFIVAHRYTVPAKKSLHWLNIFEITSNETIIEFTSFVADKI